MLLGGQCMIGQVGGVYDRVASDAMEPSVTAISVFAPHQEAFSQLESVACDNFSKLD